VKTDAKRARPSAQFRHKQKKPTTTVGFSLKKMQETLKKSFKTLYKLRRVLYNHTIKHFTTIKW